MQLPEAVIFDLGKVLLDFDYRIAAQNLQKRCAVPLDELRRLIDLSPLLHRYETDSISTEEFFGEIKSVSGFAGDLCEFSGIFGDIFTPIPPMVELHAALRRRGLPTFIFSNTNKLAVQHIQERYPFYRTFDGHILSCEHGVMKPDKRIYDTVERLSGRRGGQLLYIDDRKENVEMGAQCGWRVIWHESAEKTIESVRALGLV